MNWCDDGEAVKYVLSAPWNLVALVCNSDKSRWSLIYGF